MVAGDGEPADTTSAGILVRRQIYRLADDTLTVAYAKTPTRAKQCSKP
jgi:hypothetical protein